MGETPDNFDAFLQALRIDDVRLTTFVATSHPPLKNALSAGEELVCDVMPALCGAEKNKDALSFFCYAAYGAALRSSGAAEIQWHVQEGQEDSDDEIVAVGKPVVYFQAEYASLYQVAGTEDLRSAENMRRFATHGANQIMWAYFRSLVRSVSVSMGFWQITDAVLGLLPVPLLHPSDRARHTTQAPRRKAPRRRKQKGEGRRGGE